MTQTKLIDFKEVMKIACESKKKKHLLLGNGFSIACHDKFKYGTLAEQAKMKKLPAHLIKILDEYGNNFEEVMKLLNDGEKLKKMYNLVKKKGTKADIKKDYNLLKTTLVEVITENHPSYPSEITDSKFNRCLEFLLQFDDVYTLNYDLLMYWASLHIEEGSEYSFSDCFVRGEGPEGSDCYFAEGARKKKLIYFLHGGLHLYTDNGHVWKRVWQGKDIPIVNQVKDAFDSKKYPLFIAEGKSNDKLQQIEKSSYLSYVFRKFNYIRGNLIVFGHSLCDQDWHILNSIENCEKLLNLFVGIYGLPDAANNREIFRKAHSIKRNSKNKDIKIYFYNSKSANVWGVN